MTTPTTPWARETLLNSEGFLRWPFQKLFSNWNITLSHITSTAANTATILPAKTNINVGAGSPNGVVLGNPGDLYLNTNGGAATTLWVKESGTATNTGWIGK